MVTLLELPYLALPCDPIPKVEYTGHGRQCMARKETLLMTLQPIVSWSGDLLTPDAQVAAEGTLRDIEVES